MACRGKKVLKDLGIAYLDGNLVDVHVASQRLIIC